MMTFKKPKNFSKREYIVVEDPKTDRSRIGFHSLDLVSPISKLR